MHEVHGGLPPGMRGCCSRSTCHAFALQVTVPMALARPSHSSSACTTPGQELPSPMHSMHQVASSILQLARGGKARPSAGPGSKSQLSKSSLRGTGAPVSATQLSGQGVGSQQGVESGQLLLPPVAPPLDSSGGPPGGGVSGGMQKVLLPASLDCSGGTPSGPSSFLMPSKLPAPVGASSAEPPAFLPGSWGATSYGPPSGFRGAGPGGPSSTGRTSTPLQTPSVQASRLPQPSAGGGPPATAAAAAAELPLPLLLRGLRVRAAVAVGQPVAEVARGSGRAFYSSRRLEKGLQALLKMAPLGGVAVSTGMPGQPPFVLGPQQQAAPPAAQGPVGTRSESQLIPLPQLLAPGSPGMQQQQQQQLQKQKQQLLLLRAKAGPHVSAGLMAAGSAGARVAEDGGLNRPEREAGLPGAAADVQQQATLHGSLGTLDLRPGTSSGPAPAPAPAAASADATATPAAVAAATAADTAMPAAAVVDGPPRPAAAAAAAGAAPATADLHHEISPLHSPSTRAQGRRRQGAAPAGAAAASASGATAGPSTSAAPPRRSMQEQGQRLAHLLTSFGTGMALLSHASGSHGGGGQVGMDTLSGEHTAGRLLSSAQLSSHFLLNIGGMSEEEIMGAL